MEGWIKLHRSCLDHWLYTEHRPLTRREAWETILLTANYEPGKVLIKGQMYECGAGQCLLSLENWAKKFVWSVQQVRTFFKLLESDGMITTEGLQYATRLTICKWDKYQGIATDQQQAANKPLTSQQQAANKPLTTIKEYKEYKEYKEDNNSDLIVEEIYPFEEFWNDYDKKVGSLDKIRAKWAKLSHKDKVAIREYIPKYKIAQKDKKYRKNPETFLNNKSWNDEIIDSGGVSVKNNSYKSVNEKWRK